MNKIKIKSIIDESIDNVNVILPKNRKFSKNRKTNLIGVKSKIASTIFLNLILEIEKNIVEENNKELNILDSISENINEKFDLEDLEKMIINLINHV